MIGLRERSKQARNVKGDGYKAHMSISRTSPTPTNRPVENPSPSSSNSVPVITKTSQTQDSMETMEPTEPVPKIKKRPGLGVTQALWGGGSALNEALQNQALGQNYDCEALVDKAKALDFKPENMTKKQWIQLIVMHEEDKDKSE